MDFLSILKDAFKTCSRVISFGAAIQDKARHRLINDLQSVCSKVETAYSTVLARLHPVKESYQDPLSLAKELRKFAADKKTREAFKPDKLCGEVDALLVDLANNLDPLKYSIDVKKISSLQRDIKEIGNLDNQMFEEYDRFTKDLDKLGDDIRSTKDNEQKDRVEYARHVISDFEDDLFDAIKSIRQAKDLILR